MEIRQHMRNDTNTNKLENKEFRDNVHLKKSHNLKTFIYIYIDIAELKKL